MTDKQSNLGLSFLREKGTNFPEKPKLVEDVSIFPMPDGMGMQFRGLSSPVVLKGEAVEKVLLDMIKFLDGTRTVPQLFEQFQGKVSTREIADLLMLLFMRGLIAEKADASFAPQDPQSKRHLLFFGRRLGVTRHNKSAAQAAERLAQARLVLIAEGLLGLAVYDLLSRSGFENVRVMAVEQDSEISGLYLGLCNNKSMPVAEKLSRTKEAVGQALRQNASASDLVITALRDAPVALFDTVNQVCIEESIQWIRTHDNGSSLEVGPYVNPHDSPCLECMAIRRLSSDDYAIEEELYQRGLAAGLETRGLEGESLAMSTLAASYLAMEAVRVITGIELPILNGQVLSFYSDGNIEQNSFTRVARCEVCSRGAIAFIPDKHHAGKSQ